MISNEIRYSASSFLLAAAFSTIASGATAQDSTDLEAAMEAQRCINRCLYNNGDDWAAYQACLDEQCNGSAASPDQQSTARPVWQNSAVSNGGGQSAAVDLGSHSLSYICQRGGPGLLAVAGLGGSASGVSFSIDGRGFGLAFIPRNGILYTAADAGSPLLAALIGGNSVEVTGANGQRVSFPLSGSGAAIRSAMQSCGIAR